MRTTLTLDPDVAERARADATRLGRPFKEVVNDALRAGLEVMARREQDARPYRTEPVPMGLRAGLSYDTIGELLAHAEGEDFR
jgi:hypothetical protein